MASWEDALTQAIQAVPDPDDDALTRAIEEAAAPPTIESTRPYAPGRAWERFKAGAQQAAGAILPAPGQPGGPGGEYRSFKQRGLGLLGGLGEMALPSVLAGEVTRPGFEALAAREDLTDEGIQRAVEMYAAGDRSPMVSAKALRAQELLAKPYEQRVADWVKEGGTAGATGIEFGAGFGSATQALSALGRRFMGRPARQAAQAVTETRAAVGPRPYQEPAQVIAPPVQGPQRPLDWVEPAPTPAPAPVQRPTILGETGRPLEPTLPRATEVAEARVAAPQPLLIADEFGRPIPQNYLVQQLERVIAEVPEAPVAEAARPLRRAGELAEEATGGRVAVKPEITEQGFRDIVRGEALSAEEEIQRALRQSVEGELPEGALRPGEEPFTQVPGKGTLEEPYLSPGRRALKRPIAGGSVDNGWIDPTGEIKPHSEEISHGLAANVLHGLEGYNDAFEKGWIRYASYQGAGVRYLNIEMAPGKQNYEKAIKFIEEKGRGANDLRIDLTPTVAGGRAGIASESFSRPWQALEWLRRKISEETGAWFPSREAAEKAPKTLRQLRGRQIEGPAPVPVEPAQPLKTARETAATRTEEVVSRPVDVGSVPHREAGRMLRRGLPEQERLVTEGVGETEGVVHGFNLDTINAPDDVKRIISGSAEGQRELIEVARGPKLTDDALRSLAAESGLSPTDLMKHHKETPFTPREVVRYKSMVQASAQNIRAKLGELTGASAEAQAGARAALKDALGRHAMIAGAFARGRAQTGRALRAFQTIPEDTLDDIIPLLQQLDPDNVAVITKIARRAADPTWWDKTMFVYVNALLTSPVTHAVNIVSNTVSLIGTPLEKLFALKFGEALYDTIGIAQALKGGAFQSAMRAHATRIPMAGMERYAERLRSLGERMEVSGQLESARRMPFRSEGGREFARFAGQPGNVLAASDDFFRSVIANGELYAQGLKEARKRGISGKNNVDEYVKRFVESDATDEAIKAAWNEAKYRTFNQKLGKVGGLMLALRKAEAGTSGIRPIEFLLPFVTTPTNIAKFALERSPLGFLAAVSKANRTREQMAKPLMGSAGIIMAYLGMAAVEGKISGRGPSDPAQREVWLQNHSPYSFELEWGGKRHTISYERIEPIATVLGAAADVAQGYKDVIAGLEKGDAEIKDYAKLVGNGMADVAKNMLNKTYFQQLTAVTDAISDSERFGERLLTSLTSAIQPVAGISSLARAVDPYKREVSPVTQPISEIPFASRTLRPQYDPFGRPEERPGGGSTFGFLQRFMSPAQVAEKGNESLFRELEREGIGIGKASRELPSGKRMSSEQFNKFEQVSGNIFRDKLMEVVGSMDYQQAETQEERKSLVGTALQQARQEARQQLVEDGVLPEDALEPRALRR